MPIKSKKQWAWLFKNKPKMAKQWAKETRRSYKSLPKRARRKKK